MTLISCINYLEGKLLQDDFNKYYDVNVCCYWKEGPIYQGPLSKFKSSLSCRYEDMYVQDVYMIKDSESRRINIVCNDIDGILLTIQAICDSIIDANKCLRL